MKIALCSDIHLEFGTISLTNDEGADVLILSGDICVASDLLNNDPYDILPHKKSDRYHTFFQECAARFPEVIYIAGNHEHYHGDYAKTIPHLREKLAYLKNLHVLDKETIIFGDVVFVAGTLWTDMNKEDPHTMYSIRGYMNDFKIIANSDEVVHWVEKNYGKKENGVDDFDNVISSTPRTRPGKFTPERTVEDHKAMLEAIKSSLTALKENYSKFVVVGHHAPSKLSTKPQYQDDVLVNGAYSSDLSDFMLDNPQIKVWTHGHTHHEFDYMIGSTRIICNPRGYDGYEDQADLFKLKYFDV